ncbi:hypothetical protein HY358_01670 [Candidatus Roizmanbacteria bacterium]|nr:hypothetical protein [Candidatus Roizmanbacteria bacterium]
MSQIKTKIVATVGPASLASDIFQKMVDAGIDFIRINTSYGDYDQYDRILANLKNANKTKAIEVIYDIKKLDVLDYFTKNNLRYIALSFADNSEYVKEVKAFAPQSFLISKIETPQGVKNFDQILEHSDGIMIARGDLGKTMSLEQIPPLQKEFTRKTLEKQKLVITATEMLLSMIDKLHPTRAEVSDVANAVFEGTSAVMLSEETAQGKYPAECVQYMARIIEVAETWMEKNRLLYL